MTLYIYRCDQCTGELSKILASADLSESLFNSLDYGNYENSEPFKGTYIFNTVNDLSADDKLKLDSVMESLGFTYVSEELAVSGYVIKSPNNTKWRIVVDDSGAISTELL